MMRKSTKLHLPQGVNNEHISWIQTKHGKHGEKWKVLESPQNIGVLTPKMKIVGCHGISIYIHTQGIIKGNIPFERSPDLAIASQSS